MLRFVKGAAISAIIAVSSGTTAYAAVSTFECTPGSSGTHTLSAAAAGSDAVELTIASGAKVSVSAVVTDPTENGSLFFSPGSTVLTFPGTSAEIAYAVTSTNLMLMPNVGSVTVTLTCIPGSGQTVSDASENASSSTTIVRDSAGDTLEDLTDQALDTAAIPVADPQFTAELEFAVSILGKDRALVSAMMHEPKYGAIYRGNLRWLITLYNQGSFALRMARVQVDDIRGTLIDLEVGYLHTQAGNSSSAYAAGSTGNSPAVAAINDEFGGSNVVQNSFNLLGYGPTGGFESSTVLGRGENWLVVASAVGAISQTNAAAGGTRSLSGRGTINIVTNLAPNLAAGLGLSLGASSEDGPVVDDTAYHYAANAILAHKVAPDLTLNSKLGYELTSHNYKNGTGTGNSLSHLYTVGLGVKGDIYLAAFKLTPRMDVELNHENAAALTLSDGAVLNGFNRTTGKITLGSLVSQDYFWDMPDGTIVFTPSLGADVILSMTQKTSTAGVTSANSALGLGLTAGMAFEFEAGLGLSLSSRLSYSGETIGAGVTGKVSASF